MGVKSVLEVEVSVGEFARYKTLFDQYTEQLKKQPALWAAVAKQHKQLQSQFQHTADAVGDEHKKLEDLDKVGKENERRLEKSKSLWADTAKSSENFAKNLTSAGGFLSKWGGLLFGGIIGGAAFGIDRAVHDASSNRQQAMGLGVSIGELKAFNTNFARIGDAGGLLGSVGNMETDATQRKPWYALGLGNMSGDSVKDAMRLLDAERKFAQTTPLGLIGPLAGAYGLPSSPEQLRLMRATGNPEWDTMKANTMADIGRMKVPGAGALQELETQFGRNMGAIWSAFQTNLAKAAPELKKLSESAAGVVTSFINTGGGLGKPLADLYLKAQTDPLGAYQDAVLAPFKTAANLAKASWDAYGNLIAPPVSNAMTTASNWLVPSASSITASPQAYKNYLDRLNGGLPSGLLSAVFQQESGGNLYPHDSSAHAKGPFQFTSATASDLKINPYDPTQAASGAKEYLTRLMAEFHGDLEKALAAYNWGPQNMKALMGLQTLLGDSGSWLKYAPKETQDYVRKIEVILQNNTGGSTTVAANQLAH